MNNNCINIAISGLGLLTIDDIKNRLAKKISHPFQINWTTITDLHLDGLIINEEFVENTHIQKLIHEKNIPYLKVSKLEQSHEPLVLHIPIQDETQLDQLIQSCLSHKSVNSTAPIIPNQHPAQATLGVDFFNDIYKEYSRKLILKDHYGNLAVIDHHAHCAWPDANRSSFQIDETIRYVDATTADLVKISRKQQQNLENWLFELIWNSPQCIHMPDESALFKLHYWPQPVTSDQKMILKLSAAFIKGAQISRVAEKLNIPMQTVKKFIAANQAIRNIEKISNKEAQFAAQANLASDEKETHKVQGFFQKLKRRFGF